MIKKIILPEELYNKMIECAVNDYPRETCGVVAGQKISVSNGGYSDLRGSKIFPLQNVSDEPAMCYLISPTEQLNIFKTIRKEELDLVGIYHSHTHTEAYPSKRDVDLAFYPEIAYIIISLEKKDAPRIRAFNISRDNEEIKEIEIITVNG